MEVYCGERFAFGRTKPMTQCPSLMHEIADGGLEVHIFEQLTLEKSESSEMNLLAWTNSGKSRANGLV